VSTILCFVFWPWYDLPLVELRLQITSLQLVAPQGLRLWRLEILSTVLQLYRGGSDTTIAVLIKSCYIQINQSFKLALSTNKSINQSINHCVNICLLLYSILKPMCCLRRRDQPKILSGSVYSEFPAILVSVVSLFIYLFIGAQCQLLQYFSYIVA
jgi:hypothetical protein